MSEKLKVFISYSRRDRAIADHLVQALEENDFHVIIDRRNLPYGEEWQQELGDFIRGSDTIVWLVSPDSVKSDWCNWELGLVGKLNKRLVPIKIRETDLADVPKAIGKIHLLPSDCLFSFDAHLKLLIETLTTDLGWLKDATRLADRARQWAAKKRDRGLLLRGAALKDAENWERRQPPKAPAPSGEVLELILASKQAATRRQRYWVGGSLAVAVGALGLAFYAYTQQLVAIRSENRAKAEELRARNTLANSDFVNGTRLSLRSETMREGYRLLSRSAELQPNGPAHIRLALLLQQRSAWLQSSRSTDESFTIKPQPARKAVFRRNGQGELVKLNTEDETATKDLHSKPTNANIFAVIGSDDRVSIRDAAGSTLLKPVTPRSGLAGEADLRQVTTVLSPNGEYLAIEGRHHRSSAFIDLRHVPSGRILGSPIETTGNAALDQDLKFNVIRFYEALDPNDPPHLLLASSRGDVSLYELYSDSFHRLHVSNHSAAAVVADFDRSSGTLVSVDEGGRIKIAHVNRGAIKVDHDIETNVYPKEISVNQSGSIINFHDRDGGAYKYKKISPIIFTSATDVDKGREIADVFEHRPTVCGSIDYFEGTEDGHEVSGVNEYLTESNRKIEILSSRQFRIVNLKTGEGTSTSPLFIQNVSAICINEAMGVISVGLTDLSFEVWRQDFTKRVGRTVRHGEYFDGGSRPRTIWRIQVFDELKYAFVASQYYLGTAGVLYWLSLYDLESGLPLMDHIKGFNNSLEGKLLDNADQLIINNLNDNDLPIIRKYALRPNLSEIKNAMRRQGLLTGDSTRP